MRKILFWCSAALLLGACTDTNDHRECERTVDCPGDLVCRFDNCVSPDGVSDESCPTGEIRCDGSCVDHLADVAFCGGCGGCDERVGAEAVACLDGRCGYRCLPGFRDADADLESLVSNGCECPADQGAELCDGLDNDCDGFIDEDCADCDDSGPEVCDGVDNDCDGDVDEGVDPGEACPALNGAEAVACGAQGCSYQCTDGRVDANGDLESGTGDGCECAPTPEVCDGRDNDCDGLVDLADADFGLDACPELQRARAVDCFMGACQYACLGDAVDVNEDLQDGGDGCECLPTGHEICDGEDNDCDGAVDGDDDSFSALCPLQEGVCGGAVAQCTDGQISGCEDADYASWSDAYEADVETLCDGADNNCDGREDEHCCETGFLRDGWEGARPDDALTQVAVAAGPGGTNLVVTINDSDQILARVYGQDGALLGPEVALRTAMSDVQLAAAWSGDRYLVIWGAAGDTVLYVHGVGPEGDRATPANGQVQVDSPVGADLLGRMYAGGGGNGVVVSRLVLDESAAHVEAIALRNDGLHIQTAQHAAAPSQFLAPTAVTPVDGGAVISGVSIRDVDGPNLRANFVWGVDIGDDVVETAFHTFGEVPENLVTFGGTVVRGPEGLLHVGVFPDIGVPRAQVRLTTLGEGLLPGDRPSVLTLNNDAAYLYGAHLVGSSLVLGIMRGDLDDLSAARLEVTAVDAGTGDLIGQETWFGPDPLTTYPVGAGAGLGLLSVVGTRSNGLGAQPRPIQWWTSRQGVPLCPEQ